MKIIPLLAVFILFGLFSHAQNFFYIENKNGNRKIYQGGA